MRIRFLPFSLAILFASVGCALAQDGDTSGVLKTTVQLYQDGSKSTISVDPDQRTAEETLTNPKGVLLKKTTYLLDERNFALAAIHYDGKGNIRYKETYQRDGADHIVESTFKSVTGQPLGKRVFVYRGNQLARVEDYDAQGNRILPTKPTGPGRPDKHK